MRSVCVFCGSSPGSGSDYVKAARSLGMLLAENNITLVYGGAKVGTMGQLAFSCLEAGGRVIGVTPQNLVRSEIACTDCNELIVVDTMHERKNRMIELSDGFIALPGGMGTIEEFFEVVTWAQLGLHKKPCGLLNIDHYFDRLLDFLDHAVEEKFVNELNREMVLVSDDAGDLLAKFSRYHAPNGDKTEWVRKMSNGLI
ncbi:MAG: putative lysine decarboxylase [Methanomassiliicoccales archaeon PtaU1.Bin124]|nr:MAG: putative lysine decarboxylase [Methanomassiliicoccales archaeon PtaU1.Bin124]